LIVTKPQRDLVPIEQRMRRGFLKQDFKRRKTVSKALIVAQRFD
jgi:hypothetical protein